MKTKFILHGGFNPQQPMEDDAFFKTIFDNATDDTLKILLVYFAKEDDRIPKNKTEDIAQFEKNKGKKQLYFEVADKKIFDKQVSNSDIIYLHGGRVLKLIETLSLFQNLEKLFEGKIVVGDSAGANALPKYYFGLHEKKVSGGLGIIPIKLFCHYSQDQENELRQLQEQNPKLETITLTEYQTRVFEF